MLFRSCIRDSALRLAHEAPARAAAKDLARRNGQVSSDLSVADFASLCKEFRDEVPRVRDDDWISKFKKDYKEMLAVRRANVKAEADIAKAKAEAKAAAGVAKPKQKPPPKPAPFEAASAKLPTIREASFTADDPSSSTAKISTAEAPIPWVGGVGAAEPGESCVAQSTPPPEWALPRYVDPPQRVPSSIACSQYSRNSAGPSRRGS